MTFVDYASVVVTIALGVIGLIMRQTQHDDGQSPGLVKRPTAAGWVVLILLISSGLLSVQALKRADVESKKQSGLLVDTREDLRKASLQLSNQQRLGILLTIDKRLRAPQTALFLEVSGDAPAPNTLPDLLFPPEIRKRYPDGVGDFMVHFCFSPDWFASQLFIFADNSSVEVAGFDGLTARKEFALKTIDGKKQIVVHSASLEEHENDTQGLKSINTAVWFQNFGIGKQVVEASLAFKRAPAATDVERLSRYWGHLFANGKVALEINEAANVWAVVPLAVVAPEVDPHDPLALKFVLRVAAEPALQRYVWQ
jgi:hypothetical protein